MAFVIDIPIKGTIWLKDNASAPILGATFAGVDDRLEAFDQTGVIAALTILEINQLTMPGAYQWSFTPATAGVSWTGHILYAHNGVRREWSDDYDVVTASQADPASAFPLGQLASGQNPVSADGGRITLRNGVGYSTALDNALIWTYTDPMSLAPATSITLSIHSRSVRIEDVATLTGSPPEQTITAELTGTQTDELLISQVTIYEMTAIIDGNEVVLFTGDVSVLSDVSP